MEPVNIWSWQIGVLFIVLFLAYATQSVTGFGANVISVTLGALFLPIDFVVTVVVPLNVVLTAYFVIAKREHIDYRLFVQRIIPVMGVGLGIGVALSAWLKSAILLVLLGIIVVFVSGRELYRLINSAKSKGRAAESGEPGLITTAPWILAAGVVHGIYASGGPFLVYAIGKLKVDKAVFRATLSLVWLTLNGILTVIFLWNGRLDESTGFSALALAGALPIGILLGEYLHDRVSERTFRIVTFVLLLVAGLALIGKGIPTTK